ncbi:MAG: hypothetical protein AB1Z65_19025 [Candidatus Sulfomarinibacteraceae bacterium]
MFRAPRVRRMALAGTRKRSTPIRRSMVLCLFLAAGSVAAQSWSPLDSGTFDTLNVVYSGSFADCWVVGDGGFVAVASDCTNFSPVDVAAGGADLTSLTRGSSADIWVGGEQGVVRRRVAGVWELRDIPGAAISGERFHLFSRSSGAAWAVGDQGSVFRNPTGAADDWELSTSIGAPLFGGSGFISSVARVVGAGGLIHETIDGGATWTPLASGTTADLFDLVPGPAGSLLAVGAGGTILKSIDGGVTWQRKPTGTAAAIRALSTSGQNADFMLAVGDGGVILRSVDGGESWCFLHATMDHLRGVEMITNSTALVVGRNGVILRTDDGGGGCQPAPLDHIFADGFETGDPAQWGLPESL